MYVRVTQEINYFCKVLPYRGDTASRCVFRPFPLHSVGELSAGKASRSLAQHIPGPGGIEGMKGAASGVVGDLARARIALDERGQKLGELEERTAAMMASADSFSKHAHDVRHR